LYSKKKIVCVGGHPDDPESGCGGTLAKLVKAGHDVTVIYLTGGEAGITGKSHEQAAEIRKEEAINACAILNAKPLFAGQIDGDTIVNNEWFSKIQQMLEAENPDVVFTHWPLDTHKDHRAASQLTLQAWLNAKKNLDLYFFEVCIGEQTMLFHPTDYIDITDTQEQKKKAIYCHASQDPPGIYACGHADMEIFRGRESGFRAAEAFIKMSGRVNAGLSGLL
jgi:LmbE family N-acetylglucosaminyl deacetylase